MRADGDYVDRLVDEMEQARKKAADDADYLAALAMGPQITARATDRHKLSY